MDPATAAPLMLGLDLGTTGAKAGIIDSAGRMIATTSAEYQTRAPRPGWAEQDPHDWWSACASAVKSAVASSGASGGDIRGIGVSGQMHGSVFLDSAMEPVAPCIIWCDQRSSAQCRRITDDIGDEGLAALVGNRALPGFTAPKILWMKEHQPDLFARVRHVVLPKDYVNLRLCGELATEVSDASGTLLFDVRGRRWSDEMFDRLQIRRDWAPVVLESPDRLGSLTAEAAALTGLAAGTPLAAGGADNACGALGMGVLDRKSVV